jgi:Arm DNA-binding domain
VATITPVLWTQKVDSEGRSPLYLRIQAHRKRRLVSLGIKLQEDQWDAAKGRVRRHPRRAEINAILAARVSELESEVYALKHAGDVARVLVLTARSSTVRFSQVWSPSESPTEPSTPRKSLAPFLITLSLGALGRIRTCGLRFRKPTLYPLSYEGGFER